MNEIGKTMVEASLADSWGGITLLILAFLYFFLGALGYGYTLRRTFRRASLLDTLGDSLLFSSILLWAFAMLFGAAGGYHWLPRWMWWGAFAPGFLLSLPLFLDCAQAARRRWWAFAVFGIVFSVRALTAAIPAQHGDPLLYHLLGPRLWVEAGGFLMHPDLPNALLASTWEALYVWPQLLWLRIEPLYGLVEAQIFSQWLHLFLAWGGSAILLMRLFRGRVRDSWLPLLGLAGIFVAGVQWTAALAKNDVGIDFWVLGSLVFFLEALKGKSTRRVLMSGLLAGLAVSGKITALLSLGPLLALPWLLSRPWREKLFQAKAIPLFALAFLAGVAPIYLRNYLLSRNPFFPLFPQLFPSPWVSKSWGAHFAQVHPSSPLHSFPRILSRAPELLRESPWIGVALLLLALSPFFRKYLGRLVESPIRGILIGSLLAYSAFVITQVPEIELRYLGASLMILAAAGLGAILAFADRLTPRNASIAAALAAAALLASSKLPLHVLRKIWHSPLGVQFLNTHSAGEAKTWLRAHAGGGFVVVAGDNETYYLTPLRVAVLTERPDLDAANEQKELSAFLETLCRLTSARFLLDARPAIGVEARFGAAPLKSALVFSAQGANVYDLGRLALSLGIQEKGCQAAQLEKNSL